MVSWGSNYDGTPIPTPPTHPEFTDAIAHWNPVISPSGITFYTGEAIPGWKDNLLIGGLSSQAIIRLTLDGETVTGEERIPMGKRIRDVVQGPDGAVYALTDATDGAILKLTSRRLASAELTSRKKIGAADGAPISIEPSQAVLELTQVCVLD